MKEKNTHGVYVTLGASNHTGVERSVNDFYATPPAAVRELLKLEKFNDVVWEPACGMQHISKVLKENGYTVYETDIVDMTKNSDIEILDFLSLDCNNQYNLDIITNPPYKLGQEFVEKALDVVVPGRKVAMFLKLQFLEGKKRRKLFDKYPPKTIYVASSRYGCSPTGEFDETENMGSAVAYCWYIWEKGYTGDTIIKWFN